MREINLNLDIGDVLAQHCLTELHPDGFISSQQRGHQRFPSHQAHHASIETVKDERSGLLMVRKTFGSGVRRIPFNVAGELADDYRLHAARLRQIGVRVAQDYSLAVIRHGDDGIIETHQLLFPQGTLLDWLKEPFEERVRETALRSTIRDTVTPVLKNNHPTLKPWESWVFSDSAPKNVAPLETNSGVMVFYFDLFVPRVRNKDGSVKRYDVELHTRPEEEMQERFFTKYGIIHNFISKMKNDLGDHIDPQRGDMDVVQRELAPFINQFFPGLSLEQIAKLQIGK